MNDMSFEEWEQCRQVFIQKYSGKYMADIACGHGHHTLFAAQNTNIIQSWLLDARPLHKSFKKKLKIKKTKKTISEDFNYTFTLGDLNNPECLNAIPKDVDTILYFGHLYHATNHWNIIEKFSKSNAKFLILENVFNHNQDYFNRVPCMYFLTESVDSWDHVYNENFNKILVGAPNYAYITQLLKMQGWTLKDELHGQVETKDRNKIRTLIYATR
jgi:hypothetical protein